VPSEEIATQTGDASSNDESAPCPPISSAATFEREFALHSPTVEAANESLLPEPFVVEIGGIGTPVEPDDAVASSQLALEVKPDPESAANDPVVEDPGFAIDEPAAPAQSDSSEAPTDAQRRAENDNPARVAPDVSPVVAPANETSSSELSISSANVFDEMEILYEAAIAPAPEVVPATTDPSPSPEPQVSLEAVVQATHEASREEAKEESAAEPAIAESAHEAAPEVPPIDEAQTAPFVAQEEIGTQEASPVETVVEGDVERDVVEAPALPQESALEIETVEEAPAPEVPTQDAATQEAQTEQPATDQGTLQRPAEPEASSIQETLVEAAPGTAETAGEPAQAAAFAKSDVPAPVPIVPKKPSRAKDSFFQLDRVPEPESMDHSGEVEAYASAAAQAHLDAIDDTFVAHAQLLLKGRERGRALDIGTGPGQILIKLGSRLTRWKFVGVDRSVAMIEKARQILANTGEVAGRIEFLIADGNSLEFPDASFDLVVCNSVLHHLAEPQNLFSEIARVIKPGGAILLRDLRRPSRFGYGSHIRKHGKHYAGEMRRLYVASVQAAYTEEELQKMVAASPLRDVRVFRHGKTHIGFDRALKNLPGQK
jgi:ubiquinone/menaquinone biosynthesis C-methylase UbiE